MTEQEMLIADQCCCMCKHSLPGFGITIQCGLRFRGDIKGIKQPDESCDINQFELKEENNGT